MSPEMPENLNSDHEAGTGNLRWAARVEKQVER